jgi:hypothetical protein
MSALRLAHVVIVIASLCYAAASNAKSPNAVFGAGAGLKCGSYVAFERNQTSPNITDMVLAWAQGYFSARNTAGLGDHALTVGGSLSSDTFKSMLVDQCKEDGFTNAPVFIAAEALYDRLKEKGL